MIMIMNDHQMQYLINKLKLLIMLMIIILWIDLMLAYKLNVQHYDGVNDYNVDNNDVEDKLYINRTMFITIIKIKLIIELSLSKCWWYFFKWN